MSITIKPVSPAGTAVTFGLTDFENETGGAGGWESLARPRRRPAAGWVGTPERTIALPLIIDGIDGVRPGVDRVVEAEIARVRAWAVATSRTRQPPILQLLRVRRVATTDRWVLQDVEWGPYFADDAGRVVQQELTLTLLQYFAPTLVQGPAKKVRDSKPPKSTGGKGTKGGKGKGGRTKKRKRK